ncbi:rod shape-determining protein MreD [Alkalicoccus chagannorensis]|uniref:rod shape-determining protein MreD n=1 Tax=Alkalicoccus chagannorensis TaxID=427072 RepID=UPI00041ECF63|nr:rod shape-determining protein MreD [Alkalicoccus chagannorensis]
MSRYIIPVLLFILFVMEGTVFQIFAPGRGADSWQLIPRFMLIGILFVGIFRGRSHSIFYAVLFGALYDIVYAPVLGVNTFGFGFAAYLFSISNSFIKRRPMLIVLLITAGVILVEYYMYGLMLLLGLTEQPHQELFQQRFLPSFIMNAAVAAAVVYPVRWFFYSVDGMEEER